MTSVTVKTLAAEIEKLAPKNLAEDWDPVGLSFGMLDQPVKKVLLALDVDQDTIREAKEMGVDLMITHHPAIFKGQKTLNGEDARRRDYIELIKADIAVYSAHTNLDAAENGLNDWLADAVGISKADRQIVSVSSRTGYKKAVVYVPDYAADKVRSAMHQAGAGEIGDYKAVSYTLEGYGRFTPQEGAHPAEGKVGKEAHIKEQRIEMLVGDRDVFALVSAIQKSHPYEEPVFDLFTLENLSRSYGFGRAGKLEKPATAKDIAQQLQQTFEVNGLRYGCKDELRMHERIAVFGGSGAKFYKDAIAQGATLFITGDISYHEAQDMLRDGLDFIDAGHYIEAICVPKLKQYLEQAKKDNDWEVDIYTTTEQSDVFKHIN